MNRVPPEKQTLRRMGEFFTPIAPRYDLITRALSFGMDAGWKRRAVENAALPPLSLVLDLACGTGDFSELVVRKLPEARAVGVDVTPAMLQLARSRGFGRVVCANALELPFADQQFDSVFVGYGLRNFPSLEASLCEIRRVTRPGGVLVSLDFYLPVNPALRKLYLASLWLQGAFWGITIHGRARQYTYIADSLRGFVSAGELCSLLARLGYDPVRVKRYILGGIAVHWATRR